MLLRPYLYFDILLLACAFNIHGRKFFFWLLHTRMIIISSEIRRFILIRSFPFLEKFSFVI